ncbi:hypothetical protein ACFY12_13410 [Streptomyces sp. NPDC001339]|uniref:hypothetical protein n=1 Tax=Streptomyces sp. NPDC001339 TaxID=3364563 RepID=UPI0036AC69EB
MSDDHGVGEKASVAPQYNVDVQLTVKDDPSRVQFVNMTIKTVTTGADQLDGEWRGASVFVPSTGGTFHWDGRAGQEFTAHLDSATGKLVLTLDHFIGSPRKLPGRGASGEGFVLDPFNPGFREDILWKIT